MDRKVILSCYRKIVRYGLRSLNFKSPQKYAFMKAVRERFRSPVTVSVENLLRTATLFENAGKFTGFESALVANMVHVAYSRQVNQDSILKLEYGKNKSGIKEIWLGSKEHYDSLIEKVNKEFGLCL